MSGQWQRFRSCYCTSIEADLKFAGVTRKYNNIRRLCSITIVVLLTDRRRRCLMVDDQFSTSYCRSLCKCSVLLRLPHPSHVWPVGKMTIHLHFFLLKASGWQIALLGAGGSYTSPRWTKSFRCRAMRGLL